jgi:hypothetical protein
MKKILVLVVSYSILSCQNHESKIESKVSEVDKIDSSNNEAIQIKDLKIDSAFFADKVHNYKALSKKEIEKMQIIDLIQGYEDYKNTVKLVDTLLISKDATLLLVACEEENEHFVWLLGYDKKGKLSDSKLVFYEDFVEYFSRTFSEIKNNEIKIITESENDEASKVETENYSLNRSKFNKIR